MVCLPAPEFKALTKRVAHWRLPQPPPLSEGVPCAGAALAVARTVVRRRVAALQVACEHGGKDHGAEPGLEAAQGVW